MCPQQTSGGEAAGSCPGMIPAHVSLNDQSFIVDSSLVLTPLANTNEGSMVEGSPRDVFERKHSVRSPFYQGGLRREITLTLREKGWTTKYEKWWQ